jgi:hypothetical protein
VNSSENEPVESNPANGLRLNFEPVASEHQHDFCGPNEISGAICPACSKPLLRVLSLSAADSRLNADPAKTPAVHLLYCWTCSIPYGHFSYRVRQDGTVEVLDLPPTTEYAFGPDGPYDGYTGTYPMKKVSLVALSEEERQAEKLAHSDMDLAFTLFPRHQIGGTPVILNSEAIACPACLKPSPFLAVICDDASGNRPGEVAARDSFVGNLGVQMVFHFCRECSVVTAYHSND